MADEPEVKLSTAEVTPEPEPENPENPEPQPEPESEAEKYRKIAEDQRKRAEKAEGEVRKLKGTAQPPSAPALSADDKKRLDRIELNSLGVKDRDEQDFVLGAAQRMGVSPSEAAADEFVSSRLERIRETRKTKDATPPPSNGGQPTQNVTRLAEKALLTGELPSDPDLKAKVRQEMKRLTKK